MSLFSWVGGLFSSLFGRNKNQDNQGGYSDPDIHPGVGNAEATTDSNASVQPQTGTDPSFRTVTMNVPDVMPTISTVQSMPAGADPVQQAPVDSSAGTPSAPSVATPAASITEQPASYAGFPSPTDQSTYGGFPEPSYGGSPTEPSSTYSGFPEGGTTYAGFPEPTYGGFADAPTQPSYGGFATSPVDASYSGFPPSSSYAFNDQAQISGGMVTGSFTPSANQEASGWGAVSEQPQDQTSGMIGGVSAQNTDPTEITDDRGTTGNV